MKKSAKKFRPGKVRPELTKLEIEELLKRMVGNIHSDLEVNLYAKLIRSYSNLGGDFSKFAKGLA